jgi:hypothetical protein
MLEKTTCQKICQKRPHAATATDADDAAPSPPRAAARARLPPSYSSLCPNEPGEICASRPPPSLSLADACVSRAGQPRITGGVAVFGDGTTELEVLGRQVPEASLFKIPWRTRGDFFDLDLLLNLFLISICSSDVNGVGSFLSCMWRISICSSDVNGVRSVLSCMWSSGENRDPNLESCFTSIRLWLYVEQQNADERNATCSCSVFDSDFFAQDSDYYHCKESVLVSTVQKMFLVLKNEDAK